MCSAVEGAAVLKGDRYGCTRPADLLKLSFRGNRRIQRFPKAVDHFGHYATSKDVFLEIRSPVNPPAGLPKTSAGGTILPYR